MSSFPFKNLVFQGGGVKTFAYHGAIRALDERGVLGQIERVGGASAGAMLAAVLSFRLSVDESIAIYNTLDYAKIPGLKTHMRMPSRLISPQLQKEISGNLEGFNRLMRQYGWYETSYAYKWLLTTIAGQTGYGTATFADFRKKGFRDLHVVATNISRHRLELFSAETTPGVAVADALLLSQAIPLFFAAPRFDGKHLSEDEGDFYGDGALLSNYPLHLFDAPRFQANNPFYQHGVNGETLGCRLYTPDDCPEADQRPINNIASYISNLFETWLESQALAHSQQIMDRQRSIDISNCCISSTDFQVRPAAGNEQYEKLVRAGETAVAHYLDNYTPPRPADHSLFDHLRENIRRVFKKMGA